VEEHFYLFWPRAVRRLSAPALASLLVTLIVLTPAARVLRNALAPERGDLSDFYTWYNLDGLALGGLIAVWIREPGFRRRQLAWAAVAALATGSVALLLNGHWWRIPMGAEESFGNLIFAGLVGGSLIVGTTRWRRLVDRPFLRFCGYISYGLYLVHLIAFRLTWSLLKPLWIAIRSGVSPAASLLAGFAAGTAVAIGMAWVSRHTLEAFFLGLGYAHRPGNRTATDATIVTDAGVLAAPAD
jgi:peptidoglycan/LPS O-acetylase OafA/YrhL